MADITRIPQTDYTLSKIQDYVQQALDRLGGKYAIVGGVLVNAAIGTSDTTITHRLGKTPSGYLIAGLDADARVWSSSASNPSPDTQIILKASAAVNATLYIF